MQLLDRKALTVILSMQTAFGIQINPNGSILSSCLKHHNYSLVTNLCQLITYKMPACMTKAKFLNRLLANQLETFLTIVVQQNLNLSVQIHPNANVKVTPTSKAVHCSINWKQLQHSKSTNEEENNWIQHLHLMQGHRREVVALVDLASPEPLWQIQNLVWI